MIELMGYAALSFALTGAYRWLALHYRWLDHPNHRSSHTVITPRGAGLVFALIILSATTWRLLHERAIFFAFMIGLAVALAGWMDDVRGTSARFRFVIYIASSAIAVALILIARADPTSSVELTILYGAITALGIAWLINLYNFMDGINGLAAFEAIFVLLGINFLAHNTPYGQTFSQIHFYSCAALSGFLLWNFPTGKVFMGDAGSAFLGFFLGILMLLSLELQGPTLTTWFILLAVFIVDTGYTLLTRIATGQTFFAAHRLHAYQLLTDRIGGGHFTPTTLLMIVNVCWLLPLAWLVHTHSVSQNGGLALAYLPLLMACYYLKAGIPRHGGV